MLLKAKPIFLISLALMNKNNTYFSKYASAFQVLIQLETPRHAYFYFLYIRPLYRFYEYWLKIIHLPQMYVMNFIK